MYCLSNQHTEGLLELLEDAQSSLAMMLTSKYIGPLQHEAAAWAMKLKEISEVLDQVKQTYEERIKDVCVNFL